MSSPAPPLRPLIPLYAATATVAAAFEFAYSRLVCPLLCDISSRELGMTVIGLALLQAVVRPWLARVRDTPCGVSPARRVWRVGVLTWWATGALAAIWHIARYPGFPMGSHVKLLVGYGLLGGGVLAQAEYLVIERLYANREDPPRLSERLGRRLLESYGVFTITPAVVLLMVLVRATVEGAPAEARVVEATFLAVFFVLTSLVVAALFGRSLQTDAERLQQAVERIGDGALDTRVRTSRPDELGAVAEGINQMAQGLVERDALRDAFGRFTSAEVAGRVIAAFSHRDGGVELGGRRVVVTLLMCDLRGFTPLTESLPPERLSAVLNSWFAEAVAAVHAHGGMIDKFVGDAVFAVFGLGGEPTAPVEAVRAARELEARLAAWNLRRGPDDPALSIGVAVHTGEVTAGFFGSPERLEFTVIGRGANEVARLSDHARVPLPPALISASTARLTPELGLVRLGELQLKGVSEQVEIYGLPAAATL